MTDADIDRLLQLLQEDPEDWNLRIQACHALMEKGRSGEALGLLEAAELPSDTEKCVLDAADLYRKVRPAKAVEVLSNYLQAHPDSPLAHLAMVDAALVLKEEGRAREYYQRAIELEPGFRDPQMEVRLGLREEEAPALPSAVEEEGETRGAGPEAGKGRRKKGKISPWALAISLISALTVFVLGWLVFVLILWSLLAK